MKALVFAIVAILGASELRAQQTDAGIVAGFRARTVPQVVGERAASCDNKVLHVAGTTAAGAVMGWLYFTFGIGLLAADHGTVYQRERNKYMKYGALFGAAVGIFDALTIDCIRLGRRR